MSGVREELLAELASALAEVIRTNRVAMSAKRDLKEDGSSYTVFAVARAHLRDALETYNALLLECTDEERAEERKRAALDAMNRPNKMFAA